MLARVVAVTLLMKKVSATDQTARRFATTERFEFEKMELPRQVFIQSTHKMKL